MRYINELTDSPAQRHRLTLDDGTVVDLFLRYVVNQQGWFYDAIYGTSFSVAGKRVVNSPNMLRAFRDIIPFGFACTVEDGLEPILKSDFKTARAKFYLLANPDEVEAVETQVIDV